MDKSFFNYDNYKQDKIRAVDAKFEAQKIAFAPLCYQAIRTMIETGILQALKNISLEKSAGCFWKMI